MELEERDVALQEQEECWTLVYIDHDDNTLKMHYYSSLDELLEDCESEDGEDFSAEDAFVFEGELSPMRLQRKLCLVKAGKEEDDDEEDFSADGEEEPTRRLIF